jgi:hypothetical protein
MAFFLTLTDFATDHRLYRSRYMTQAIATPDQMFLLFDLDPFPTIP